MLLDKTINDLNNRKDTDADAVMGNFNELNLNSRQLEIIKSYISENIFQPKSKPEYENGIEDEDVAVAVAD